MLLPGTGDTVRREGEALVSGVRGGQGAEATPSHRRDSQPDGHTPCFLTFTCKIHKAIS